MSLHCAIHPLAVHVCVCTLWHKVCNDCAIAIKINSLTKPSVVYVIMMIW